MHRKHHLNIDQFQQPIHFHRMATVKSNICDDNCFSTTSFHLKNIVDVEKNCDENNEFFDNINIDIAIYHLLLLLLQWIIWQQLIVMWRWLIYGIYLFKIHLDSISIIIYRWYEFICTIYIHTQYHNNYYIINLNELKTFSI